MDPSRDPFVRRQILSQPAMAHTSSLPSGQSYYTLESLEGATSLPFLKPAPPASLPRRESFPLSSERDALLHLDAQARALQAEREVLDARARLLAAERGSLLRNLPPGATALPDQSMYGGGLQAVDTRPRVPLEGLKNPDMQGRSLTDNARVLSHGLDARPGASLLDIRSVPHGLDARRGVPLQLGSVNVSRVPPVVGGIPPGAAEHGRLSELLRSREPGAGFPFLPPADPMLARRDGRVEALDGVHSRLLSNGARDSITVRSGLAEANKIKQVEQKQSKGPSYSKPLAAQSAVPKIKPPSEQSEGWCAVCKLDCHNIKGLTIHLSGKKHKAAVEQQQGNVTRKEVVVVKKQGISALRTTASQADKKRGNDSKLEASESAKRLKASVPASAVVAAAKTPQAKAAGSVIAQPATSKAPPHLVCKLCNISTTGAANLESHMKGKRHAARVKELANPGGVVSGS